MPEPPDAVVVGGGPNGLSAAITLARAGRSVWLYEARGEVGGGVASALLTLSGYLHDVCSAVYPLAVSSPAFRPLALDRFGLEWVHPPFLLAHPFDDGSAAVIQRSLDTTAAGFGADGESYRRLLGPLAAGWEALSTELLGPLFRLPGHPFLMARFGLAGLRSAAGLARARFRTAQGRALFAGVAAHAGLPLGRPCSAAFGLVLLAAGHAGGWPLVQGGAGRLAAALAACLESLGGHIITGQRVSSLDELPRAQAILLDLTPRDVLRLAGTRLPHGYRRRLARFRYGPAAFKVDFALGAPIPWRAEACRLAGTVHLGGSLEEIEAALAAAAQGEAPRRPFVILSQPTLFDPTRAPAGAHTAWAYCHVPNGWSGDAADLIGDQIERFAPGFRDRVLARHALSPSDLEALNPNYVGGDIAAGATDARQLFLRPVASLDPYATPASGLYLCSASTPPGPGVHGLCGYWAARSALRRELRVGNGR